MKKRGNGLIVGVIIGTIMTNGIAFAKQINETSVLSYDNIKISLNGHEVLPKDANNNYVEPFTINGTTYLPVRAVANALGINVNWDDSTNTVVLSNALSAPFTLTAGQYVVGEDIEPGKYSCSAVSGSGNFSGTVESLGLLGLNEILAEEGNEFFTGQSTYDNLRLEVGDIIRISGNLHVEFVEK